MDLESGGVASALVGSVDVATAPLQEHRRRLHLAVDTPLAEGSHWLWLGSARTDRPRRGEVLAVEHFRDDASLLAWIVARRLVAQNCAFSAGQFLVMPTPRRCAREQD